MKIHCYGCNDTVDARLITGAHVYKHRPDLWKLPLWICDACGNFVGCHYKTGTPTKPLGCIPTKEIKELRQQIHRVLDPLWRTGRFKRKEIYATITRLMGGDYSYHTAEIKTADEARKVLEILENIESNKQ